MGNGCDVSPSSLDHDRFSGGIHQLKYIVEDEIAVTLPHQLECLRKVHWLLFIVNL